ncbi:MAG: peptidoglycan-binding protein [Cyanobacteria bacterium P01_F01_bin.150]
MTIFSNPAKKKVCASHCYGLHIGLQVRLIHSLVSSRCLLIVLGCLLVSAGEEIVQKNSNTAYAAEQRLLISQAIPEIQEGDSGPQVRALQERLKELGYFNESITGYFGEITEAAVIQFQRAHGLTADGIVGSGTTNSLRKAGPRGSQRQNNPLTLEEGDQGPAVETLQNQLTTLGYYDGPISGYFGPLTEAALIRFQNDKELVSDGVVGNATQSAIDSALQRRSSSQSVQTASADTVNAVDPNDGVWEVGETGGSVEAIQRDLQTLGYYSRSIDGDYGSGTEAAVMAFQSDQNLAADGKAGPATLSAIQTAINTQASSSSITASAASSSRVSTLPPAGSTQSIGSSVVAADPTVAVGGIGVSDRNVLEVQRQLQDRGYYTGELDGDLGPTTRQAIQSAQQTYGLQRSDFD